MRKACFLMKKATAKRWLWPARRGSNSQSSESESDALSNYATCGNISISTWLLYYFMFPLSRSGRNVSIILIKEKHMSFFVKKWYIYYNLQSKEIYIRSIIDYISWMTNGLATTLSNKHLLLWYNLLIRITDIFVSLKKGWLVECKDF